MSPLRTLPFALGFSAVFHAGLFAVLPSAGAAGAAVAPRAASEEMEVVAVDEPDEPSTIHEDRVNADPAPAHSPAPAAPAAPAARIAASTPPRSTAPLMTTPGPASTSSGSSAPVHFALPNPISASSDPTPSPAPTASTAPPEDDGATTYSESGVDSIAVAIRRVDPVYPREAQADGVEGEVKMELVVSASGVVESARLEKGVRSDMDAAAIDAIRRTHFTPAMRHGHAVRLRMGWTTTYRLR